MVSMRNSGLVQDATSDPIVASLFWFLTEKMFYPLKSNPVSKFSLSMRSQKSLEGSWKTRFGKKKSTLDLGWREWSFRAMFPGFHPHCFVDMDLSRLLWNGAELTQAELKIICHTEIQSLFKFSHGNTVSC